MNDMVYTIERLHDQTKQLLDSINKLKLNHHKEIYEKNKTIAELNDKIKKLSS